MSHIPTVLFKHYQNCERLLWCVRSESKGQLRMATWWMDGWLHEGWVAAGWLLDGYRMAGWLQDVCITTWWLDGYSMAEWIYHCSWMYQLNQNQWKIIKLRDKSRVQCGIPKLNSDLKKSVEWEDLEWSRRKSMNSCVLRFSFNLFTSSEMLNPWLGYVECWLSNFHSHYLDLYKRYNLCHSVILLDHVNTMKSKHICVLITFLFCLHRLSFLFSSK